MARRPRASDLNNLRDYLDRRYPQRVGRSDGLSVAAFFGTLVSLGFLANLFIPWLWAQILGTLCIGVPIAAGIAAAISESRKKPRNVTEARQTEIVRLHDHLRQAGENRKLHKKIDPVAAVLFDECARHWLRIQAAFQSPMWHQSDLPAHWRSVRDGSLRAADEAMDEILLMLRTSIREQGNKGDWEGAIKEFLEDVVGFRAALEPNFIPIEFEPARQVGEKLRNLASQVEKASNKLALENPASSAPLQGASTSIDSVLSELHSIEQAESELEQHLRNN